MRILLDTHAFLWFLEDNPKLSRSARTEILSRKNICYVSIASLWEISIKLGLQKLTLEVPFSELENEIKRNFFQILPVEFTNLQQLQKLEFYHKDPFDRLIIAQAISENLTIISRDENFKHYKEAKILW